MEHVSNWKTGKLFHLGPFFYGRRFPEIVMNLQIVSAVPKLHFSANSYLSDENHSAVTKALASSGCYSSNGIFPQRLSRRGLGVKIRLIPSILLQLGQFQLLPSSCALRRCRSRTLWVVTGCQQVPRAAGASLQEETHPS